MYLYLNYNLFNRPVSSVVKRALLVLEVWGLKPGPVKPAPTVALVTSAQCRQRLATVVTFLRSCVAQALSCGDGSRRYTLQRNIANIMKI